VREWLRGGPTPLWFPNTVFGVSGATSAPLEINLKNPGTVPTSPITLEGMQFGGADPGDFALLPNKCPSVLNPGLKCSLSLTFTPSGLGLRYANLKVFDNAGNAPQIFYLRGYGVRAKLELSTTAIYFGHVGKNQISATHSLTLTNPNPVALSVGKVAVLTSSDAPVSQFVADGCAGMNLVAGAQCAITVTFNPTKIGVITGDIRIYDNARNSPQNVYLQGTGIK
jgi:hypothetical protein